MLCVSVNRLLVIAVAVGIAIGGLTRPVRACPFCLGSQELTLRERIETPDVSILVEWQTGEPGNLNQETPASTTFNVLKVWQGELDTESPLTIDRYQEGRPAERFLLIGSRLDDVIRWDRAIPLSEAALEYVQSLPTSQAPIGQRLRHAFRHLESDDTTIANDAFAVIAAAKYEDIAAERSSLNVESLRQWVHDPETHVSRLGVYGMLLGLAGSPEDIPGLHRKIFVDDQDQPIRIGIDGVMGGYLLLTGAAGLAEFDEAFLHNSEVTPDNLNAAASALRFLWEYGEDIVSRDRLRQSMRLGLNHAPIRHLVIADLARWQDWAQTDRLVTLYQDEMTDKFVRQAIIQFLLVAREAKTDDLSDEETAAIKRAAESLEAIRQTDPELYRRASRFFVPHTTGQTQGVIRCRSWGC